MSQAPEAKTLTKEQVIELVCHWNECACSFNDDELRQVIEWIESHDRRVQLQLAAVREILRIYEETKA